jgi:hypothetical protein
LVDAETLMRLALLQYWALVDSSEWNSPDKANAIVIALEAEVVTLHTASNKNQSRKANNKAKSTTNVAGNKGKGHEAKPEWMTMKPKDGEAKKKVLE